MNAHWIVYFTFLGSLAVSSDGARAAETAPDPRFLSQFEVPLEEDCNTDVSNDGRHVYTICDAKPGTEGQAPVHQAKLYIHDISDLKSPHKISETEIGKVDGYRLIVRNGIAFYQGHFNGGIAIIDARDPQHPKPAGHIDTGYNDEFRVSDDGQLVVIRSGRDKYIFVDVSDPSGPKEIPDRNFSSSELVTAVGKWSVFDSGKINGIPDELNILDTRNKDALVSPLDDASILQLYNLSIDDHPKLVASFAQRGSPSSVNLVPEAKAIISGEANGKGAYVLKISAASNLAFDPQRLVKYYDFMEPKYGPCIEGLAPSPDCIDIRLHGLAELKDDGIDKLVDELPDGITSAKRIVMLNNYGYWLVQQSDQSGQILNRAVTVLNKVVELSPNRSVAWLNLGDTNAALIKPSISDVEKAQFWKEATKDFDRYKSLSGRDAPGSAALASFDLPQILNASKDVCEYVAKAFNAGKQKEISSPEGKASIDGRTVTYVVGWAGGSCASEAIKSEGCADQSCDEGDKLDGLKFPDEGFGGSGLLIIPYHDKYYTVSGGPGEVVDPNSGPVCSFERHYHPVIVENKSPMICEKFLHGELKAKVNWTPVGERDIENANISNLVPTDFAFFDRSASVAFNGKPPVKVGHFNITSGAGCGCDHSGIAMLAGNKMADENTEPNKSLIALQSKWWRCGGSDADLTPVDGVTYVEASGAQIPEVKGPPRALLRLVNGVFEPICRIEQMMTVTPAPPLPVVKTQP